MGRKKPRVVKLIKRARGKNIYRTSSNSFDYITSEKAVPLADFMEQLELSELPELINLFYDFYSQGEEIPDALKRMKECNSFIK